MTIRSAVSVHLVAAVLALATCGTVLAQSPPAGEPLPPGDAANGEKIFNQCKACHTVEAGAPNRIGPNLHGVVGRKAAQVEGFNYSQAMKNANITWDDQSLSAYLADPKGTVPGNKMAFAGLKQPQQRADVIAYLKRNSPGSGSAAGPTSGTTAAGGGIGPSSATGASPAPGEAQGTQPGQTIQPGQAGPSSLQQPAAPGQQ